MQIPSLNIIGAGRLGQTLGRLFHTNQCFQINGICNSSELSAKNAVDFVGAGGACRSLAQLPPADVVMIATPDALIKRTANALTDISAVKHSKLVFHCSGVTTSSVLLPLKNHTTSVASIHPNMTFASAKVSVDHFSGTYCAFEGDDAGFDLLENAFKKIGGQVFQIKADQKATYHAATALSCNYLIALMDVVVQLYLKIGVTRETALAIMQPIVKKTVDNVFSLDTVAALTGPIARGDVNTVQLHLNALEDPYTKDLYKQLGLRLVQLATEKGNAEKKQLGEIERLLNP